MRVDPKKRYKCNINTLQTGDIIVADQYCGPGLPKDTRKVLGYSHEAAKHFGVPRYGLYFLWASTHVYLCNLTDEHGIILGFKKVM